jgi:hypothetical protein
MGILRWALETFDGLLLKFGYCFGVSLTSQTGNL